MAWVTTVVEALPKLRTKLQLTGLIVAIAAIVATRAVAPQALNAQLSAGAVGVLFIVFGQVFSSIKDFPEQERSRLVLLLFGIFCIFVLALIVVTGFFVSRAAETSPGKPATDQSATLVQPTGEKSATFSLSGSFDNGYAYSPASTVTLDTSTGLELSAISRLKRREKYSTVSLRIR